MSKFFFGPILKLMTWFVENQRERLGKVENSGWKQSRKLSEEKIRYRKVPANTGAFPWKFIDLEKIQKVKKQIWAYLEANIMIRKELKRKVRKSEKYGRNQRSKLKTLRKFRARLPTDGSLIAGIPLGYSKGSRRESAAECGGKPGSREGSPQIPPDR